jgi:hypothetical protein
LGHARLLDRGQACGDLDRLTRRRELGRVLEQVHEHLDDTIAVAPQPDGRRRRPCVHAGRAPGVPQRERIERGPHQRRQIVVRDVKRGRTGLHGRQVEDPRDHGREPLRALPRELEHPPLPGGDRTDHAIEHNAHRLLHRCERRLQVVRDLREETALHPVQLTETARHLVEVHRELRELVVVADIEPVFEVSLRDLVRAALQLGERARDRPHDPPEDQQCEEQRPCRRHPRDPLRTARGRRGRLEPITHGELRSLAHAPRLEPEHRGLRAERLGGRIAQQRRGVQRVGQRSELPPERQQLLQLGTLLRVQRLRVQFAERGVEALRRALEELTVAGLPRHPELPRVLLHLVDQHDLLRGAEVQPRGDA